MKQPDAPAYLDLSERGFWLSFSAMVFAAPIAFWRFLSEPGFLEAAADLQKTEYVPFDFASEFTITVFSYSLGWIAFPILMVFLTRMMNVAVYYAPYIIIRNWTSLLTYIVLAIPPMALFNLGVLSVSSASLITFLTYLGTLYLMWFLAREALHVSPGQAISVVAIDVILFVMIRGLINAIVYG